MKPGALRFKAVVPEVDPGTLKMEVGVPEAEPGTLKIKVGILALEAGVHRALKIGHWILGSGNDGTWSNWGSLVRTYGPM